MKLRLLFALLLFPLVLNASVNHPLDALEEQEILNAVAVVRNANLADDKTLFSAITLQEPPKKDVLAWKNGEPIPREAKVIFRRNSKTYEAIVDLKSGKLLENREIPGAQPFITMPEILSAIEITVADPRMQEGIRKRGIVEMDKLFCAPRTVGNFGEQIEKTKRIVKVDCFDIAGIKTDVFAKPIEGLFAIVDLDQKKVLKVTDLGIAPVPGGNFELDPSSIGDQRPVKPVVISSPNGSNISMEGSMVHWQNWSFHLRWDIRSGVVISLVNYKEKEEPRSILYEGYLSEIFVPYQDPTESWYFRNYMDAGEYGFGTTGSELIHGSDCPSEAIYLSPVISNAGGGVDTLKDRICVFERAPGEPAWRHFDIITQALEGRPNTELIVRFVATVGNYDYVMDWIFDQRGSITYRGGATGIDSVKGVKAQNRTDATAAEDTAYGSLVSPGRVAIYHDHFLCVRLDVDIDGQSNTFARSVLVPEKLPAESKRKSIWRIKEETAKIDADSKFRLNYEHPSMWHVMNMHKMNSVGYPVGYMIHSEANALPVIGDDVPLSRAMFANYHLWVTPYEPSERYAAGDYPNQSSPGQGLPAWTSKRRNIDDQDIVLWYILGFHHLPSTEDWPVYNLGWHSVTLKPYNFFDQNPAIDLPPAK